MNRSWYLWACSLSAACGAPANGEGPEVASIGWGYGNGYTITCDDHCYADGQGNVECDDEEIQAACEAAADESETDGFFVRWPQGQGG
jgi:hypothetical protein